MLVEIIFNSDGKASFVDENESSISFGLSNDHVLKLFVVLFPVFGKQLAVGLIIEWFSVNNDTFFLGSINRFKLKVISRKNHQGQR